MQLKKLLSLLCFALTALLAHAQDIHFTQYNMSPMTLNPANTGKFEGTIRIGGIYRDQWGSIIKQQFRTPSAWVDAPIIRGFRKNDWIGVGFMLYQDKVGVGGLTHSAAKLGAAYHLALGKKGTTVITLGAMYGGEQRKVTGDEFRFSDGYNSNGDFISTLSMDYGRFTEANANYQDVDAGVQISSRLNKQMDFNIGFAMYHVGSPNYSLGSGNANIPRRSVVSGRLNAKLNDKFGIHPTFLYQTAAGLDEILLQAMGSYLFNAQKDITFNFGLGYRMRDGVQPIVGVQYKALQVGLAYDINTSDLNSASRYRGGFELAANYIFKIYKPAVIKPKVLCPRF